VLTNNHSEISDAHNTVTAYHRCTSQVSVSRRLEFQSLGLKNLSSVSVSDSDPRVSVSVSISSSQVSTTSLQYTCSNNTVETDEYNVVIIIMFPLFPMYSTLFCMFSLCDCALVTFLLKAT